VAVAARGADQAAEEALACAVGVYAGLAVDKVCGDDEAGGESFGITFVRLRVQFPPTHVLAKKISPPTYIFDSEEGPRITSEFCGSGDRRAGEASLTAEPRRCPEILRGVKIPGHR
jgi:hypothetical protein